MFKKRFEQLCNERKTSPAAVCEAIGLSNSVYSKWNENSMPRNTTLLKIADFFNVSVAYLKGETDNPLPHSDQIKEYLPYEKRGMRPVIGLASAGVGVIAEEMILGWQYVDDEFDNENCFWIKIAGDSMSPKIDDGDLVLIQREVDIEDGDIVVAVVDRQRTASSASYS